MFDEDSMVERTREELRRARRHGPLLSSRLEQRLGPRPESEATPREGWRRGTTVATPLLSRRWGAQRDR